MHQNVVHNILHLSLIAGQACISTIAGTPCWMEGAGTVQSGKPSMDFFTRVVWLKDKYLTDEYTSNVVICRGIRIHIERYTGYKCRGSGLEIMSDRLHTVALRRAMTHFRCLPFALDCSVQHARIDGVDVHWLHAGRQFLPVEAQIWFLRW